MIILNPYIFGVASSYLVDDYSPLVAYSLDQISSSITNVIRLRRDSDNAESDFTADELYDGTCATWTGANNAFVAKWYNQGTGGATYDLTQTTAGDQPRMVVAGVVNTEGMEFQNNGDGLKYASGVPSFNSEPYSYFVVHKSTSTNIQCVFSTIGGTGNRLQHYSGTSTAVAGHLVKTSSGVYRADPSSQLSTGTTYLSVGISDSSKNMSLFQNNTTMGTDTFVGTYTNNALNVGLNPTASQQLLGTIAELIIFGTDETSNRADIQTNINDRLSIY